MSLSSKIWLKSTHEIAPFWPLFSNFFHFSGGHIPPQTPPCSPLRASLRRFAPNSTANKNDHEPPLIADIILSDGKKETQTLFLVKNYSENTGKKSLHNFCTHLAIGNIDICKNFSSIFFFNFFIIVIVFRASIFSYFSMFEGTYLIEKIVESTLLLLTLYCYSIISRCCFWVFLPVHYLIYTGHFLTYLLLHIQVANLVLSICSSVTQGTLFTSLCYSWCFCFLFRLIYHFLSLSPKMCFP